jgi:hypothetical protein
VLKEQPSTYGEVDQTQASGPSCNTCVQARLMGIHAAYSMLGLTEEYGSDISLELVGGWVQCADHWRCHM